MDFKITSKYKPTGDQPQAIRQLTEGVLEGDPAQVLLGVTGSGKTFTVANVIANVGKPTLILSHNKTLAAQLYHGMIEGRISKELKEVCLVDQVYVKAEDGKQTVAKYLEEVSKAVGGTVKVKRFVRFETGEGLEKKQEDFAAEVAAQMNA